MNISILKEEYFYLLERSEFLACLEDAGVDNWQGYSYAREEYNKTHKDGE